MKRVDIWREPGSNAWRCENCGTKGLDQESMKRHVEEHARRAAPTDEKLRLRVTIAEQFLTVTIAENMRRSVVIEPLVLIKDALQTADELIDEASK